MRPALAENVASDSSAGIESSRGSKLGDYGASRRRILFAWLIVLAWAGVIWQFGSDTYSLDRTSRFLQPLFNWLLADLDLATRLQIHAWVRKSAHFIEYAILALLAFRAALLTAARHRIGTAFWVALFLVATLAAADEFRQSLSTARTGSPFDVLIDVTGGVVGLLGLLVIMRRMRVSKGLRGAS
jgi:VanZ family protein